MAAKTRKTTKTNIQDETKSERIIENARAEYDRLDRECAVLESDLERAKQDLINITGTDDIDSAMGTVKEMNKKLPGLQQQRDDFVLKIETFLNKEL